MASRRCSRQASVLQSRHSVFPVPVGLSRMPFTFWTGGRGEAPWAAPCPPDPPRQAAAGQGRARPPDGRSPSDSGRRCRRHPSILSRSCGLIQPSLANNLQSVFQPNMNSKMTNEVPSLKIGACSAVPGPGCHPVRWNPRACPAPRRSLSGRPGRQEGEAAPGSWLQGSVPTAATWSLAAFSPGHVGVA